MYAHKKIDAIFEYFYPLTVAVLPVCSEYLDVSLLPFSQALIS